MMCVVVVAGRRCKALNDKLWWSGVQLQKMRVANHTAASYSRD